MPVTWVAVHGGEMVLVVLVGGQFPGADGRVERVRVGDEVRVSQVGYVVCGGEGRRVGGRVALWRLGGDDHPADPCVILQHLGTQRERWGGGGMVRETVDQEMLQMDVISIWYILTHRLSKFK